MFDSRFRYQFPPVRLMVNCLSYKEASGVQFSHRGPCERGETNRRAGPRSQWAKHPCRCKSCRSHQSSSGRRIIWLIRLLREQEIVCSNHTAPTNLRRDRWRGRSPYKRLGGRSPLESGPIPDTPTKTSRGAPPDKLKKAGFRTADSVSWRWFGNVRAPSFRGIG